MRFDNVAAAQKMRDSLKLNLMETNIIRFEFTQPISCTFTVEPLGTKAEFISFRRPRCPNLDGVDMLTELHNKKVEITIREID